MQKKSLLICLFVFLFSTLASSQTNIVEPPFKRFPTFPPVRLMKTDSISYFTKDSLSTQFPSLLIVFNPECEHCKQETEAIIQNIDKLQQTQIVMATFMPFDSMLAFVKLYELDKYSNILTARDVHFFLPGFFQMRSLPFLAFYNKNKQLISVFEGAMPIDQVIEELKK